MTATQTRPAAVPSTPIARRLPQPTAYWPALDGLRGLAVLAVVAYHFHIRGLAGGWIGVDVFFVISGFVVTSNLLRSTERNAGKRPPAWRFYVRRAARLYPALLAMLVFGGIWTYIQDGEVTRKLQITLGTAVAQVYNVAAGFDRVDNRAFTHLWSLGIEWQFYLIVPFVVAGLFALPRRLAAGVALGFAVFEMVLRPFALAIGVSAPRVYVLSWFRLDGLLLGMAIAFAWQATTLVARQGLYQAAWLALAALAVIPVVVPGWFTWQVPSLVAIVPLASVATAVLVMAVVTRAAPRLIRVFLEWKPLRWIGERSYSIYLWHYVVGVTIISGGDRGWLGWSTLGRQLLFTTIAALASYTFIEQPARQWLTARLRSR